MQLTRFPNVHVVPVCSVPQNVTDAVRLGRPTDFLPRLHPSDVLYACGAPPMVDSLKAIATQAGVVCYADPFLPTTDDTVEDGVFSRAMGWLSVPTNRQPAQREPGRFRQSHREPAMPAYRTDEAGVRGHYLFHNV